MCICFSKFHLCSHIRSQCIRLSSVHIHKNNGVTGILHMKVLCSELTSDAQLEAERALTMSIDQHSSASLLNSGNSSVVSHASCCCLTFKLTAFQNTSRCSLQRWFHCKQSRDLKYFPGLCVELWLNA